MSAHDLTAGSHTYFSLPEGIYAQSCYSTTIASRKPGYSACRISTFSSAVRPPATATPHWRLFWTDQLSGSLHGNDKTFDLGPDSCLLVPPPIRTRRLLHSACTSIHIFFHCDWLLASSDILRVPVEQQHHARMHGYATAIQADQAAQAAAWATALLAMLLAPHASRSESTDRDMTDLCGHWRATLPQDWNTLAEQSRSMGMSRMDSSDGSNGPSAPHRATGVSNNVCEWRRRCFNKDAPSTKRHRKPAGAAVVVFASLSLLFRL